MIYLDDGDVLALQMPRRSREDILLPEASYRYREAPEKASAGAGTPEMAGMAAQRRRNQPALRAAAPPRPAPAPRRSRPTRVDRRVDARSWMGDRGATPQRSRGTSEMRQPPFPPRTFLAALRRRGAEQDAAPRTLPALPRPSSIAMKNSTAGLGVTAACARPQEPASLASRRVTCTPPAIERPPRRVRDQLRALPVPHDAAEQAIAVQRRVNSSTTSRRNATAPCKIYEVGLPRHRRPSSDQLPDLGQKRKTKASCASASTRGGPPFASEEG